MYVGTVPGDRGIYILRNRSREHAIPLHGVESLALGPPPPKHHHKHVAGARRSQAPDGGEKAHQRPLADITVLPTAHLPKDFGMEHHIVLEGHAQHIVTAALYTLAAHEHHWDATAITAMPPPSQGPKDPINPCRIDQLLCRRASPHLHPSRMEIAIASWDTLDTQPPHPAVQILKADAKWWVLYWAHGVLMAAKANTPKIDLERPPTTPAAIPPSHQFHRQRGRPVGSPVHSTLLGSRVPQRSRHTGTHRGLGQTGKSHEELPPPPPF